MKLIDQLRPIAKAIIGFITPGVAVLIYATTATSAGGEAITTNEWLLVLGACLGTGATVYAMPNKATKKRRPAATAGLDHTIWDADGRVVDGSIRARNQATEAAIRRIEQHLTALEQRIVKGAAEGVKEGIRKFEKGTRPDDEGSP